MALLGYNGGLRGKPRIPSTGNASGLWDLEEQKIAKGAGIWPGGVEPDPYWANVLILYRFSGASVVDAGPDGNDPITVNNVSITSGESPFAGGSSGYFDGTSGSITMPNITLASLASLTVEFWVKPEETRYHTILSNAANPYGDSRLLLSNTSVTFDSGFGEGSVAPGAWSHVAYVHNANVDKVYINGIGFTKGIVFTPSRTYNRIGNSIDGTTFWQAKCWLSELRITANIARYTSDFTPPTAPFPNF